MAIYSKKLNIGTETVREVDALEDVPVSSAASDMPTYSQGDSGLKPGKWVKINSTTAGSTPDGWTNVFESDTNITVDGESITGTWKFLRTFAYESGVKTYSRIVVNNPLMPGEQIEISFYASQGLNLSSTGTGSGALGSSEGKDIAMQVLYTSNSTHFDDFLKFPTTSQNRSTVTHELGDGDIIASNGSNVGAINGGWQYSTGRSDSSFSSADFSEGVSGDPNNIGRLYAVNVPDEDGSEYSRFFRITIRNDTSNPAYLVLRPFNWNTTWEYWTFYDMRFKVTSASVSRLIGGRNDITHFKAASASAPLLNSDSDLDFKNRTIKNVGSPIDTLKSAEYGSLINKKWWDNFKTYAKPVILLINGDAGSGNDKHFASLTNMEYYYANDGLANAASTRTWAYLAPAAGRFYKVCFRTEGTFGEDMEVHLRKYTSTLGSGGNNSTMLCDIDITKKYGGGDSFKDVVEYGLPIGAANNGVFAEGDVLILYMKGDESLLDVVGTMVLLLS